ncbi:MAG: phosphoribosylamine--glycine ligase [Firmicutes bacterium]|nr:phosphoribosylamine--glycine ligase [Candidatus Fermentithermobacillaceae bacterium]
MRVLVIGSGGREHALAWALSKSPSVTELYIMPGNPGTLSLGENIGIDPMNFGAVLEFCQRIRMDLVVVGPENPLAAGIADYLRAKGISVFGPGEMAARLESSKSFAKQFMQRHGIPHPRFEVFEDPVEAKEYVNRTTGPWVIKADGLALGKGVLVTGDRSEALTVLANMMSGKILQGAGRKVVIEEYLSGYEVTAMALVDGERFHMLPVAKDHKRLLDGDEGPMTGGMGAISPVPLLSPDDVRSIERDVFEKVLRGLQEEDLDYRGILYAGLMMTREGPKVLEFNVRFGDPEAQCVLPRLEGDLAEIFLKVAQGRMDDVRLTVRPEASTTVVMASRGYPGEYEKGFVISGIDDALALESVLVFQAGTMPLGGGSGVSSAGAAWKTPQRDVSGKVGEKHPGLLVPVKTWGGRVLSVTALGTDLEESRKRAYEACSLIRFEGAYYRKDIGKIGLAT